MLSADLPRGLRIREFDPQTSTLREFQALNRFINDIKREGWPAEDLTSVKELARKKRSVAASPRQRLWAAWQAERLIGLASLNLADTSTNRHAAEFSLEVEPAFRRRGLATRLLRLVADAAAADGRTLLLTWTSSRVSAAGACMEHLPAEEAQVMSINQLDVDDLNGELIRHWTRRGETLQDRLELGFWDGAYPEADIDAIAEMRAVMNTMPRDKLALEDEQWTAEQLRAQEAVLENQGGIRHTAYVRSRPGREIAGFTEVFWKPAQPAALSQGDTGVSPEWRNQGIATWLKAAMLQRMLQTYPEVRRVRTWNGVTNQSMLRINEQLGFRACHYATNWQLSLAQVEAYLASK